MESQLVMGYMLHADDKFVAVGTSLEEAQEKAKQHMGGKLALTIKSAVGLTPTRTWNYDYGIRTWVEKI